jgi:DNA-binding LacI/PurR family transcriptional regulator
MGSAGAFADGFCTEVYARNSDMLRRKSRQKKKVTLRDVAEYAGVSPKTVSNVVNNWPYITDQTRQKVQQAIDELGYRPDGLATSLRTGRTNTIGVVIPDITNPFFGQVVRGCEDVLYAAGYNIFLCNTNEDQRKEQGYLAMLVDRGVDGLLLFGARSDAKTLSAIVHDTIPIVAEDCPIPHNNTTVIDIENITGARLATEHLIAEGHRRIGHLGGPLQRTAAEKRKEGYRQALEHAGIPYDRSLIFQCPPSLRGGYRSALRMLQEQKPTALFCYNDLIAVGAMIAARHLGIDIPSDIAIVGFDDIALASLVDPALTTIRVRQYVMGRTASELLLERLSGIESPATSLSIPVELVIRNSSRAENVDEIRETGWLEYLLSSDLAELSSEQSDSTYPLTEESSVRTESVK